jgi:hypothetical protein
MRHCPCYTITRQGVKVSHPSPSREPRPKETSWGIIGAVAGVAGVIIALVPFLLHSSGGGDTPPPRESVVPSTRESPAPFTTEPFTTEPSRTAPPDTRSPRTEPPAGGSAPAGWTQAWQGRVLLPKVAGLELDSRPAMPVNGADPGADLRYSNDEALGMKLYAGPRLTELSGSPGPDPDACYQSLVSLPIGRADPAPQQVYCVGTSEGGMAWLQVEDASYDGVVFQAVVWQPS